MLSSMNDPKTTTMIAAAAVITRAVEARPSATEVTASPVRSYSSREPPPHWKTAATTPYAAPIEARFMTTALSGTSRERNTIIRITNDMPSTAAKNSGVRPERWSVTSMLVAAPPVTWTSRPLPAPGITSSRSERTREVVASSWVTCGWSGLALTAPLGSPEEPLSLGSFRGGSSAVKSDANQACSYDWREVDSMRMRSWLPVGVAAFVGRKGERAKVADLVTDRRVVTLTGPGGCGKTRLAVEVVANVASEFPGGAFWVDLQGVSESRLVAPAVGAAMGVQERPGEALADTLVEQLHARHLLLVLDNCEHLVEVCADLVSKLSSACPELHVLATSRVPLVLDGEVSFEVAPLPVPGADAVSASAVATADAARLFEVRARQVAADFRIGDDNASAVAEICRRLDGIPLAIELAAARVRVLAPGQIAAALSDRFRLLKGGARGAPARQRTLQASLDWSYDLLDDAQRLALARLSVFAGSFELDAAEAVVGGDGIDSADVLDLVCALAAQSMLQVVQRRGRARYRLLETIRVYARQRLSELDSPDRVRDRHLEFHVGLATQAQAGLHGRQPEAWVARLAADLDDLRAAMDWAAETGGVRGLVGITEPIVRFWFERGLSREVHRRLHEAAEVPGAGDEERVRGLNAAAGLALATGEPASFHRSAKQAVAVARAADLGDALAVALAHQALSGILSGLSTSEQVDADVEEALQLAKRCENASTHAHILQFAGAAVLHSRSIDAGHELFQQCVEVCEANDLAFHLPAAHAGAPPWLAWSGRLDQTRRHARRAVELSRQLGRPGWEAAGLTGLAAAAVLQGDHIRAQDYLAEAKATLLPRALQGTHYGMWMRHWLSVSAYASGDLEAARAAAEEIVRIARGGGSCLDEAVGEWLLGVVAHAQERHDEAREHLEASRALSTNPLLPHTQGRSLLGLADLARENESFEEAWELAHGGLGVLDEYGDRVGTAAALETIAHLSVDLGDPERALRLLAASERFHTEWGIARFPVQVDRFESARKAAYAALESTAATGCWSAGAELSLADAVGYARRGRGERQRPKIGWASLTPAEREVVRLVAEGHTNAQIGRRLFISVNTVKRHLSRVYAKVDVDGRAELAAQVARRAL
jgi:predicted ATPase/DNA-binding CsgD family transcriptional regulator